jgi:hypothetical protein
MPPRKCKQANIGDAIDLFYRKRRQCTKFTLFSDHDRVGTSLLQHGNGQRSLALGFGVVHRLVGSTGQIELPGGGLGALIRSSVGVGCFLETSKRNNNISRSTSGHGFGPPARSRFVIVTEAAALVAAATGDVPEPGGLKHIGRTIVDGVAQVLEPANGNAGKDVQSILPQSGRHHFVRQAGLGEVTTVGIDGQGRTASADGLVFPLGRARADGGGTDRNRANPLRIVVFVFVGRKVRPMCERGYRSSTRNTWTIMCTTKRMHVPTRGPFRGQ